MGDRSRRRQGRRLEKAIGLADDHEAADGVHVLDFFQAADKARKLARGSEAEAGRRSPSVRRSICTNTISSPAVSTPPMPRASAGTSPRASPPSRSGS